MCSRQGISWVCFSFKLERAAGLVGKTGQEVSFVLVDFRENVLQVFYGAPVPEHVAEQDDVSEGFVRAEPLEHDQERVSHESSGGLPEYESDVGVVEVAGSGSGFREGVFWREHVLHYVDEILLGDE